MWKVTHMRARAAPTSAHAPAMLSTMWMQYRQRVAPSSAIVRLRASIRRSVAARSAANSPAGSASRVVRTSSCAPEGARVL